MSDIKRLIQSLADTKGVDTVKLLQCSVDSVDLEKRTCRVTTITGSAGVTFDAQLSAGVADGTLAEPAVDSMVYVLMSISQLPFVVQYSDIVSYVFLGGEYGGLVKVVELTEKLNNLENKVKDIILKYNALTMPVSGSTAGPPTVLIVDDLTPTQRADIENVKIKHGAPDEG